MASPDAGDWPWQTCPMTSWPIELPTENNKPCFTSTTAIRVVCMRLHCVCWAIRWRRKKSPRTCFSALVARSQLLVRAWSICHVAAFDRAPCRDDRLRMERRRPRLRTTKKSKMAGLNSPAKKRPPKRLAGVTCTLRCEPCRRPAAGDPTGILSRDESQPDCRASGWPIGTVKTRLRMAMEQLRVEWLDEKSSGG